MLHWETRNDTFVLIENKLVIATLRYLPKIEWWRLKSSTYNIKEKYLLSPQENIDEVKEIALDYLIGACESKANWYITQANYIADWKSKVNWYTTQANHMKNFQKNN
ncbi:hypothetical protein M2146_001167 [Lachnospiraceae bacterium PF1-22]